MKQSELLILMGIMSLTTYLVRMIPFVLFRHKIRSRFFRSVTYYMPYAILSAMSIPGIFYCTGDPYTATGGFLAAVLLTLKRCNIVIIALGACAAAVSIHVLLALV